MSFHPTSTLSNATRRTLLGVLLLTVVLHGVMALSFELSTDEAHYALYGFFPALSYFDHPPLVGWSQMPFMALFGGQPPDWALRVLPLLCHAATLWLLTGFANHHFGDHAARWTVLILAVSPLPHVLGAAQVPDSLLIFWAAALLVQTDRLIAARPTLRQWLLLGATLGLAGLSKYTAVLFVLPILYCLLRAHGLRLLRTPGPWLAVLASALLISPVLIWNAQHAWISFAYQTAHGTGDMDWQAVRMLRQIVLQLLAYGPLLTLLPLGIAKQFHARAAIRLVLCFALPFLALMFYLAGGSNALPHWTAPAWMLLAPLAGAVAAGISGSWLKILAGLQAALCVALVGWMLSGGTPDPQGLNNPPADLYGWRAAGEQARRLAEQQQTPHLAVQNWSIASRIAWYGRPLPLHVLDERVDQFDLWYGDLPVGADAILIDWSSLSYELPVGPGQFAACQTLGKTAVERFGKVLSWFDFYRCTQWGGHPAPQEKSQH